MIYLAAGWLGTFFYAKLLFPQPLQRALAASLFIGNGFFICRLAVGHVDFIPFLLLPAALSLLHRGVEWSRSAGSALAKVHFAAAVLALAAGLAVSIDGSPVVVLHEVFWIFLYGAVLAARERSAAPVIMLGLAGAFATALDAGYLWPMVAGQWDAPRLQAEVFTHPLALPWYLLVPSWGRFYLPANGKGHELSVFIGPVLGALAWIYRRPIWRGVQRSPKLPLIVVALASIWLGMGSLQPLHVPRWLSPFDLLRLLPGFRSMGVTGRYWGFLALPLSLFSAGGLWAFVCSHPGKWRLGLVVGLALLTQLAVQTTALLSTAVPGRSYQAVPWKDSSAVDRTPQFILRGDQLQGALVGPERAVIDCYDEDDIPHADVVPGTGLVRSVTLPESSGSEGRRIQGRFLTWSRIRIEAESPAQDSPTAPAGGTVEICLNQAYHRYWSATGGEVGRTSANNLVLRCDESLLRRGPVELLFRDPISDLGWSSSRLAWMIWGGAVMILLVTRGLLSLSCARSAVGPTCNGQE